MIHFDGDALVYIAGFGSDSRNGPFSHAAHNLKLIIGKVTKALNDDEFRIFLTSKDSSVNFRHEILKEYKANRFKFCAKCKSRNISSESFVDRFNTDGGIMKRRCFPCLEKECDGVAYDRKPVYYNKLRNFLIERYGALICQWGEADDWLAVRNPDTIATHDKDLYQVGDMGFYNLKTDEQLVVFGQLGKLILKETNVKVRGVPQFNKNGSPKLVKDLKGYGFKWFCAQMIIGDKADNIAKPHKGDGPVYIYNLFEPLKSLRECWEMVKLYYHGTGQDDKLWIAAQLLWVARKKNQRCSEEVIEGFINEHEEDIELDF